MSLASILKSRAEMLRAARDFFEKRGVLEVDCGALVPRAPIDSNIDVIEASVTDRETGYLHTSPEYAMKRLLALGSGDIFFLGRVYRKGEIGRLHNPEFTMAEWYRVGMPFEEMMKETAEFLFLFLGIKPLRTLGYRNAFMEYLGIDFSRAPLQELQAAAVSLGGDACWDRQTSLHFLLTHGIEPLLGRGELTFLLDYPPSEAALACVVQKNGEDVAERFEIYCEGVELANGYHELADAKVLRSRFEIENREREAVGKKTYLLDELFLEAVQHLPECCGVSIGFDRALMLRQNASSIHDVLPFCWKSRKK